MDSPRGGGRQAPPSTRRRTTRASGPHRLPSRCAQSLSAARRRRRRHSAAAAAPAAGSGAQNRPPTVTGFVRPVHGRGRRTAIVTADAQDPDGDPLTYQWDAKAGTLTTPTAPADAVDGAEQPGPGAVHRHGQRRPRRHGQRHRHDPGHAAGSAAVRVRGRALRVRPVHAAPGRARDSRRARSRPCRRTRRCGCEIEGHTCNIGTTEYNLALGDRRARAVRDYLVSRGIATARLTTVSYGEERPRHDNAREDTRRLNRRAALVVRLQ